MKENVIHLVIAILLLPIAGFGALAHHYDFSAADPFADQVGTSDLTQYGSVGSIDVNAAGYLSFSGTDTQNDTVYLGSDVLDNAYDPFVLSLWFRFDNPNQSNFSSIFSTNKGTSEGFQVHFYQDTFGVNANGNRIKICSVDSLSAGDWHLVTVMQDSSAPNQGMVWLDDCMVVSNAASFGALNDFRLGVNRAGRQGFEGDISSVKIYDSAWDDSRQAAAYSSFEAIPEPASISFILLAAVSALGIKRFCR